MSFETRTKREPAQETPGPVGLGETRPSERRRRMATGGTRSTFMGSAAMAALPAAGPSLTGVST